MKLPHVVHHGYGFQLEWNRMKEGVEHVEQVFSLLRERLLAYLQILHESVSITED